MFGLVYAMSPVQVEIRTISKRGGSLTLNIPTEFARKMGIEAGSPVVFQYDQDTNSLLIEKVESIIKEASIKPSRNSAVNYFTKSSRKRENIGESRLQTKG